MARRPTGRPPGRPRSSLRDEALRLRREGVPYLEVAARLGVTVGTARTYVCVARRRHTHVGHPVDVPIGGELWPVDLLPETLRRVVPALTVRPCAEVP